VIDKEIVPGDAADMAERMIERSCASGRPHIQAIECNAEDTLPSRLLTELRGRSEWWGHSTGVYSFSGVSGGSQWSAHLAFPVAVSGGDADAGS
jgi:hypothetical protein